MVVGQQQSTGAEKHYDGEEGMNKQREALKLALEVLEEINKLSIGENAICLPAEIDTAMDAIREALAEPEQKPVAVVTSQTGDPAITMSWHHEPALPIGTKLYAAPPARKPLTDEQIREIDELVWKELSCEEKTFGQFALKIARAIERAHGIGEA